jgi:hypothetical protein
MAFGLLSDGEKSLKSWYLRHLEARCIQPWCTIFLYQQSVKALTMAKNVGLTKPEAHLPHS